MDCKCLYAGISEKTYIHKECWSQHLDTTAIMTIADCDIVLVSDTHILCVIEFQSGDAEVLPAGFLDSSTVDDIVVISDNF